MKIAGRFHQILYPKNQRIERQEIGNLSCPNSSVGPFKTVKLSGKEREGDNFLLWSSGCMLLFDVCYSQARQVALSPFYRGDQTCK